MRATTSAVRSDTARRVAAGGAGWNFPSPSTIPRTSRGWIHTPWLATAANTEIIWMGVTATPCPTGIVHRDDCRVLQAGGRVVAESLGVEARGGRHGQDVAGVGVHDDDRAAPGVVPAHGVGQRQLDPVLDLAVDRGDDVLAGNGGDV